MRVRNSTVVFLLLTACQAEKTVGVIEHSELSSEEQAAVMSVMSANLKTPYDAHYILPAVTRDPRKSATKYCGCVNAKNSFGGYIGYYPFSGVMTAEGGAVVFRLRDVDSADSNDAAVYCIMEKKPVPC